MLNLKFALRTLFKTPFVTFVAIVSLALGIGANAAIFSLFSQLLLQPVAVPEPAGLVNLSAPGPKPGSSNCGRIGNCQEVFSYQMFRDLERVQTSFTGIAAHVTFGANFSARGQTENGDGLLVSGSYFPLLGLQPAIGRLLGPEDDKAPGEPHVVVLSYGYWLRRFALDPSVLGQPLIVNGVAMTIVGVAPRGFESTSVGVKPQVFAPISMRGFSQPFRNFDNRRNYWAYLFARLKPGVSLEQASATVGTQYHAILNDVEAKLQTGMSEQTMARFKTKPLLVTEGSRGQSSVRSEARLPMTLLLGVTAFVLLIACANIANLLLARGAARAGEMAVRLSIGAGRGQLVRQLLGESLLLAAFGGLGGIIVARWTLNLMAALLPAEALTVGRLEIDPRVMLFAAALALGTGLLFGLFPALHNTRPDLVSALKGQSGQPSGARAAARFRASLATAQIALSMALLVSAGLFTRSLFNVSRVNLGLTADHVIMFRVSPELNGYKPEQSRQLFERMEAELAALPGVKAVTASTVPLLSGSNWGNNVAVEGSRRARYQHQLAYSEIGPGYFRARHPADRRAGVHPATRSVREGRGHQRNLRGVQLGRDAISKRISDLGTRHRNRHRLSGWCGRESEARPRFRRCFRLPAGRRRRDHLRAQGIDRRRSSPRSKVVARIVRSCRSKTCARCRSGCAKRLPRSLHQRAVGRLRLSRDAARGDRPLRRARLHRVAADARDRLAHGARRGAVARADDGAAPGRRDDDRRRRRRSGRRRLARLRRAVAALRSEGMGSGGPRRIGRRVDARRARRRVRSRASGVAGGSDERAAV